MKAATSTRRHPKMKSRISIHAAREGGDNHTHDQLQHRIISIHAAREGGDDKLSCEHAWYPISIHAAREGGDVNAPLT